MSDECRMKFIREVEDEGAIDDKFILDYGKYNLIISTRYREGKVIFSVEVRDNKGNLKRRLLTARYEPKSYFVSIGISEELFHIIDKIGTGKVL